MKTKEMYIITTETSVIFPYFDECGRLLSMVMEGDQLHIIHCKPIKIIDFNLKLAGSSLKGASEGAGEILGSTSMSPVAINKTYSIYFTPTMSPKSHDCIWVALGHVKEYVKTGDNQVKVTLRNGSVAELPLTYSQFDRRVDRVCKLQYLIETNTKQVMKVRENYTQSYILRKKETGLNFEGE